MRKKDSDLIADVSPLLDWMAYHLNPVNYDTINNWLRGNLSPEYFGFTSVVWEMNYLGLIQTDYDHNYVLTPECYLKHLSLICNSPSNYPKQAVSDRQLAVTEEMRKSLPFKFSEQIRRAYLKETNFEGDFKSEFKDLARHPHLSGIIKLLFQKPEFRDACWKMYSVLGVRGFKSIYERCHINLEMPDSFSLKCYSAQNPYLSELEKLRIQGMQDSLHLIKGEFDKLDAKHVASGGEFLTIHAIHLFYKGHDVKETLSMMEQSMGLDVNGLFNIPFYDFCYIQMLGQEGSPKSLDKLKAISKLKDPEELPARLGAIYLLGLDPLATIHRIDRTRKGLAKMDHVIIDTLKHHFGGEKQEFKGSENAIYTLLDCDLRLIQMEYLSSIPAKEKEAKKLSSELKVGSILKGGYTVIPEWEEFLNEAQKIISASNKKASKSQTKTVQDRIIYQIFNGSHIQPILQKAQANGWSKGRNISIKTFLNGLPEMSSFDREMISYISVERTGFGHNFGYYLYGKEAIAKLTGHPNVIDENELPVTIKKEQLQLTVKLENGKYVIKTNVDNCESYNGLVVFRQNSQLYRVIEFTKDQANILQMMKGHNVFPQEAKTKLSTFLEGISQQIPVFSDLLKNKSDVQNVKAQDIITVRMVPLSNGIKAELFVKPLGSIPPYCHPGKGDESVLGSIDGKNIQTTRNLAGEKKHLSAVMGILEDYCTGHYAPCTYDVQDQLSALEVLEQLRQMPDECQIEWPEGARFKIQRTIQPGDFNISVKGAQQWFEVDGDVRINEKEVIKVSELLEKTRQSNGRFIPLSDTEYIALTDQLKKQLQALDLLSSRKGKKIQISPFTTQPLEELERLGVSLKTDKKYKSFCQRVKEADELQFTFPKGIQAELREYQKDGVLWMARLAHWGAGACLADDMGLGKTLQSIVMLLHRAKMGPSLVVMPTGVLENWKNEILRFAPSLNPVILHAQNQDRKEIVNKAQENDVILTSYGLLVSEQELLCSRMWNMVVLDEAHTIKNKQTKMSQAAMLLQSDFRVILTGTPLQNHLGEIWNLFQFSNPGLLGSLKEFQERFIIPIEKDHDKERQKQLRKLLLPFILRRTKNEVLDELPQKSEVTLNVELTEKETAFYESLRRQAVLNIENNQGTAMQALAEITRLRQAACHPALIDKNLKIPSSKTAVFLEKVEEIIENGHHALVFSQFTSHLALIREELDNQGIPYLYLDGSHTTQQRQKLVELFQSQAFPLFLISLKAGGLGLNLTAADYVFHLDPWWNPAVEDQASDRSYRIGQTRPVTIYRLIAQHTIEEKIVELHRTKKSLADSLLEGSDISHKLTKEEMLELLRG